MILLSTQLKLIIFSFIFGFLFAISVEIFNDKTINVNKLFKVILSMIFVSFFVTFYFIGIKKICYAIFHIYSLIFIIIGFIFYDLIVAIIAKPKKR